MEHYFLYHRNNYGVNMKTYKTSKYPVLTSVCLKNKEAGFCGKFFSVHDRYYVKVGKEDHPLVAFLGWDALIKCYVFLITVNDREMLLVSRYEDGGNGAVVSEEQLNRFMDEVKEGKTPTSFFPRLDFLKYLTDLDRNAFDDFFNYKKENKKRFFKESSFQEFIIQDYNISVPRVSGSGTF